MEPVRPDLHAFFGAPPCLAVERPEGYRQHGPFLHFGLVGFQQHSISWSRIVAAALLIGGTLLMAR